jgi:hypothetical protein
MERRDVAYSCLSAWGNSVSLESLREFVASLEDQPGNNEVYFIKDRYRNNHTNIKVNLIHEDGK